MKNKSDEDELGDEIVEDELSELMENHDIDRETAEKAQELIDEGLDEDDAIEIAEEL